MEPLPPDQARLTIDALLDRFRIVERQRDAAERDASEQRVENALLRHRVNVLMGQTAMPMRRIVPAVPDDDDGFPPSHNID